MLGIILILALGAYLAFIFPTYDKKSDKKDERDPRLDSQLKKLWTIAQSSMKERKPVRAEKALLTILKFDEKNAAAYNRLGILYAKKQQYDEAIECFEIAQSLDNNASSLHNAGLIYLETGAYEKAAMAFRQALELEGDLPARHIALAKAEEKIGNRKNAIEALETAYDLDHSVNTLRQILAIHEASEDAEAIAATASRIEAQLAEDAKRRQNASHRQTRTVRRVIRRPASTRTVKPKPVIKRPAAKPVAKTLAKPATRPATKATIQSAAKAAARPVTRQPAAKATARPATSLAAKSTAKSPRKKLIQ